MGLRISSESSKKEYNFGYSGLHQIRWIAYKIHGGKKNYVEFMSMQNGALHRKDFKYPDCESFNKDILFMLKEPHYDWSYIMALQKFPNLMWHSDCDGTYSKNGKVASLDKIPLTGNSRGLLSELKILKKKSLPFRKEIRWDEIFNHLFGLVDDVVEKGDGKLILG